MSGIYKQVCDLVNDLVENVVENEEIERVVTDLIQNVVEREHEEVITIPEDTNSEEWPMQVGGATLKVHSRRVDNVEGRFRGAATFVTLQIEIPRSLAMDPSGPERFGDAVINLVNQNIPANASRSNTKVGIVFESDEILESVGLCFKDITKINAMDIVESMEDMAQSNKSPLELQVPRMSMRITYITPPSGSGKRRFKHEQLLNQIVFEKRRRQSGEDEDFEALHNNEDVVNDNDGNGAQFLDGEAREVNEEEEEEDDDEEQEDDDGSEGRQDKEVNVMRNNVSRNCLPHALYQAMRYFLYKNNQTRQNRKKYKDSLEKTDNLRRYKTVHDAVQEMKERAGVTKSENFDYEDIQKFQDTVFVDYQIVCMLDRQYVPYFQGPDVGQGRQLYLSLENQHYCGVRSLCALFRTKYYCGLCETGYRDVRAHYKCKLLHQTCGRRKEDCPQTAQDVKARCETCGVEFRSVVCYENHKIKGPRGGKSRCDVTYTCKKCKKPVYRNKNCRPHVCGESYCHRCQQPKEKNHHCTMLESKKQEKQITRKRLYFDIESRADDDGRQHPILFVSLKCCPKCCHTIPKEMQQAGELRCTNCSPEGRLKVIECVSVENQFVDVAKEMTNYIFSKEHRGFVAVAHNASGYDGQFILENLIASNKAAPKISLDGTKVIYLKHNGVKMVDSLKYLTMSLSTVAKTFQVDSAKGDFPVQFIKPENYEYVGPVPPNEFFALDNKTPAVRKQMERFLEEERASGKIFNFSEELYRYCFNDVYILSSAMTIFETSFESMTNVCLLEESVTAASAAIQVFRRNHLKTNSIVLDAKPAASGNASVMSQKYLAWIGHSENVQVNISSTYGEKKVGKYNVDGFINPCPQYPRGKIIEFYGCYYHAHSCKYSDESKIGEKTAKEIRASDKRREKKLMKKYPLEVVHECEVEKMLTRDKEMAAFFEDYEAKDLLFCEKALFGGRTEVFKLYADNERKKLHYLDVVSLYPTVMKYERFPVGPPVNINRSTITTPITCPDGIQSDGQEFDGFLKCRVIPPRGLKLPLLPSRTGNRLMFTLCTKCAKQNSKTRCSHSDEERAINGTFTTPELKKALSLGYVVTEVFHAVKYDEWIQNDDSGNGGLFTSFIKEMMIEKIYSSGYPQNVVTLEEKDQFRKSIEENENIVLDEPERFVCNPGKRAVAKLMLNSLWGKFAQRVDRDEVVVIIKPANFWKMMYDTSLVIVDVRSVNNCMIVKYRKQVETLSSLRTGAVHIAALVTSYARLRLYSFMEKVGGDDIIYCDTDSIVFSVPEGVDNPLAKDMGPFFGQLTNEVKGEMTKFVTIGPKTYCYKDQLASGDVMIVRKAKGVSINSNVDKMYTINLLERMVKEVMEEKQDQTVVHFDQFTMRRDQQHHVYAHRFTKQFKYTFTKRQVLSNGSTLPYGF